MKETVLLERLQNKEEAALRELMLEYQSYIECIVSRILLPVMTKEDVQEVVSDVFYRFWACSDRVDLQKGSIKTYLTAAARNQAKNKFRSRKAEVPIQEQDYVDTDDLLEEMEKEERRKLIGEALSCLKPEEREIMVRYYYLYENTSEIAGALGIGKNTVKSKLRRGRRKLEGHLRERGIF